MTANSSGRGRRHAPRAHRVTPKVTKRSAPDQVALQVKHVVDGGVRGDELLSGALRLQPLHEPLASSYRLMRVLHPVVRTKPSGPVVAGQSERSGCRAVRTQPGGADRLRPDPLPSQQLSQEPRGGCFVSALLHKHVQHLAFAVDGAPQEHALARDPHDHLVQSATSRSAAVGLYEGCGRSRGRTCGSSYGRLRRTPRSRVRRAVPLHHANSA